MTADRGSLYFNSSPSGFCEEFETGYPKKKELIHDRNQRAMDLSQVRSSQQTKLFSLPSLRREESRTAGRRESLRKMRVLYG